MLKPASNDKIAKNRFYLKDIDKHFHEIYAKFVVFVSSGILGMFALNQLYRKSNLKEQILNQT